MHYKKYCNKPYIFICVLFFLVTDTALTWPNPVDVYTTCRNASKWASYMDFIDHPPPKYEVDMYYYQRCKESWREKVANRILELGQDNDKRCGKIYESNQKECKKVAQTVGVLCNYLNRICKEQ